MPEVEITTERSWIWEWCRMFLVYLAITISSWLVLCFISPLLALMFFSGSPFQRGLYPGMPGYFSLVEFLTSWSGFFTVAGIIAGIYSVVAIIFMVV